MSHQATTWVMEFSKSRLADRLVLGAIAHRISNDDGDAWPSIKRIQKESNLSERQVYDSIKALVAMGELETREWKSEIGTTRYHMPIFLTWVQTLHPAQNAGGAKQRKKTLQSQQNAPAQNADEPSLEPSLEPSESAPPAPITTKFCPECGFDKKMCMGHKKPKARSYPNRQRFEREIVNRVQEKRARKTGEDRAREIAENGKILLDPSRIPEILRPILPARRSK